MARRMRRRAAGAVKPLLFCAVLAGLTALAWKEVPAVRRELKIWMM